MGRTAQKDMMIHVTLKDIPYDDFIFIYQTLGEVLTGILSITKCNDVTYEWTDLTDDAS